MKVKIPISLYADKFASQAVDKGYDSIFEFLRKEYKIHCEWHGWNHEWRMIFNNEAEYTMFLLRWS